MHPIKINNGNMATNVQRRRHSVVVSADVVKPGQEEEKNHACFAAKFSILTPSRSAMISAIHCRWQCAWSRS